METHHHVWRRVLRVLYLDVEYQSKSHYLRAVQPREEGTYSETRSLGTAMYDKTSGGRTMQAEPLLSLAVTVAGEQSLGGVLEGIVRGLATQPGVALARIWLLGPGDLCDSCFMRAECRDRTQCLQLVASAGTPLRSPGEDWSFLQGHFRRIPLNARKVGMIGATGTPIFIGDFAPESQWIARPDWAKREDIRGFAGHPLIFRG